MHVVWLSVLACGWKGGKIHISRGEGHTGIVTMGRVVMKRRGVVLVLSNDSGGG
jgi:hypothetical protein